MVRERETRGSREWWEKVVFPFRRVCIRVATRLGIRKSGSRKLRHDVRTSDYEDLHVMWNMLNRMDTEPARSPVKKSKRALQKVVMWAKIVPRLCRTF